MTLPMHAIELCVLSMITVDILTVGMFILMFGKYLLRLVTHRNCGTLIIFVFRSTIEYSLHKGKVFGKYL